MALEPLKRSRQRQGPSLAFHTIGVHGYFGSVQPPLSEIPGSAPAATFLLHTPRWLKSFVRGLKTPNLIGSIVTDYYFNISLCASKTRWLCIKEFRFVFVFNTNR